MALNRWLGRFFHRVRPRFPEVPMGLPPPSPTLPLAPSARAARLCGLLALVCLLLPAATILLGLWFATAFVGLLETLAYLALGLGLLAGPLGLGAILLHLRARHLVRAVPDRYRAPGPMGSILGAAVLALWLVGSVLLILTSARSGRDRQPRRQSPRPRLRTEAWSARSSTSSPDPGGGPVQALIPYPSRSPLSGGHAPIPPGCPAPGGGRGSRTSSCSRASSG